VTCVGCDVWAPLCEELLGVTPIGANMKGVG